ncbi:IS110 family transposase [Orientia tsutsugamushi]|uniref:IS110 family transposase n=1 Tax=Orientia tsutsugamushi TaxID=784 RepID=A0A2U3QUZ8_ORITS|nr:IS110 family transposase [Orientia tsutsugamushi]
MFLKRYLIRDQIKTKTESFTSISIFIGNNFELQRPNKVQTRKFNNSSEGFNKLVTWLKSIGPGHVCIEATGIYWKNLAKYLYDYGYKVSVVNPARIKGFAMSKLSHTKTDKADSVLIANFCKAMKPEAWYPQHIIFKDYSS